MRVITIDPLEPDLALLAEAAAVLREGGLVAFPTETVYGLGANAQDASAVERVFAAKGRPHTDPLIVHVHADWPLERVFAEVPDVARRLVAAHWPGPLTLVGLRTRAIPPLVTAGRDTVAVRAPSHPVAMILIELAGIPVAAPSANRFSYVSPTSARHVIDDLGAAVDVVLDGGTTTIGIESTVVSMVERIPVVLRHGALPAADLGIEVEEAAAGTRASESPGRLDKHYAPTTSAVAVAARVRVDLAALGLGRGVVVGYDDSRIALPEGWDSVSLGDRTHHIAVARRLYETLRMLDAGGYEIVVVELTGEPGLGVAIDDRLTRAASGRFLSN